MMGGVARANGDGAGVLLGEMHIGAQRGRLVGRGLKPGLEPGW